MNGPFRVPTRILMAPGCLSALPEVAAAYNPEKVLLVTDPGIEETGWPERAWQALATAEIETLTFDEVEPNPRDATIDRMADWGREEGVSLVIGLGGGSVLDAAKAAAMLIANGGSCRDYEGRNRFEANPLPFIAVPTTCGTGSEVTWVSVITVEERQAKISVKGEGMFPDWAIVDADLLKTLPSKLVAWTGVDALTHALEAYTCRASNPVSDTLAASAAGLLFRYLRPAAEDIAGDSGEASEAREAVMRASTVAGMAFGNADVAAVHCLSETLGGRWDTPHGLANAMLLAPVTRYNLPDCEDKLATLDSVLPEGSGRGVKGAEGVLRAIEDLVSDLGIPAFRELEIPRQDYPWIADRATRNGSNASNPRAMGPGNYLEILEGLTS
jgi:alcohol dehydrogenase